MSMTTVLAAVPVPDTDEAARWYERLLGRPADTRPMEGLVEWHAPNGGLQLVLDPHRAGGGLATIQLDDLRAHVAEAAERGVALDPVDDRRSDKVLFAVALDPYGNSISLVQLM